MDTVLKIKVSCVVLTQEKSWLADEYCKKTDNLFNGSTARIRQGFMVEPAGINGSYGGCYCNNIYDGGVYRHWRFIALKITKRAVQVKILVLSRVYRKRKELDYGDYKRLQRFYRRQ